MPDHEEIEAVTRALKERFGWHGDWPARVAREAIEAIDRARTARAAQNDETFHQHAAYCHPPCECDCAGCRAGNCSLARDARGDDERVALALEVGELRAKLKRAETARSPQDKDHEAGKTRHGRDFPVNEAARLLREGVYLPDYPIELIAEAWRRNYESSRDEAGIEALPPMLGTLPKDDLVRLLMQRERALSRVSPSRDGSVAVEDVAAAVRNYEGPINASGRLADTFADFILAEFSPASSKSRGTGAVVGESGDGSVHDQPLA